jgi:3-deoxy-manno-octulosonate cytidylyltransferase (CMP-KDO synthetase)
MRIDLRVVDSVPLGVDTPGDLERARALHAAGYHHPERVAERTDNP